MFVIYGRNHFINIMETIKELHTILLMCCLFDNLAFAVFVTLSIIVLFSWNILKHCDQMEKYTIYLYGWIFASVYIYPSGGMFASCSIYPYGGMFASVYVYPYGGMFASVYIYLYGGMFASVSIYLCERMLASVYIHLYGGIFASVYISLWRDVCQCIYISLWGMFASVYIYHYGGCLPVSIYIFMEGCLPVSFQGHSYRPVPSTLIFHFAMREQPPWKWFKKRLIGIVKGKKCGVAIQLPKIKLHE